MMIIKKKKINNSNSKVKLNIKADKDGNGLLNLFEFIESISEEEDNNNNNSFDIITFDIFDHNKNGKLDYEEVVDLFSALADLSYQERNNLVNSEGMKLFFNELDLNKNGQIEIKEFLLEENFKENNTSTEIPKTTKNFEKLIKINKDLNYLNKPINNKIIETTTIKNEKEKLPIFWDLITKKPEILELNKIKNNLIKNIEIKHLEKNNNNEEKQNLITSTTETIIDDHIINWIYGNLDTTTTTTTITPQITTTTTSTYFNNKLIIFNSNLTSDFIKNITKYYNYSQLELLFSWEDGNFDGKLNFDEFISLISNLLNITGNELPNIQITKNELAKSFYNLFDLNKDGKLSYSELVDIFVVFTEQEFLREYILNDKELKEIFLFFDINGDGFLDFEERKRNKFYKMFFFKILFSFYYLTIILALPIKYFNKLKISHLQKNIYLGNNENNNNLFNLADTNFDCYISFKEYYLAWGFLNHLNKNQINKTYSITLFL
ncbi:hypothetical protein Mgra_00005344 [Meloidogyne graminicola]|uniref:EF-hand domain-containing protein n=1 Tax=Meloidogyne graminicola TaxID=189291 RepID=A0A8S9ZP86_9BILA|nr:hypothetical protein Mgra_00005344 [Meloidogyne graminicola]